jgi:hypothetical protein
MFKKSIVTSLSVSALLLTAAQANAEENSQSEVSKVPTNVQAEAKNGVNEDKAKASSDKVAKDVVSPEEKAKSEKADDKKASDVTKSSSVASPKSNDTGDKPAAKGLEDSKSNNSNMTGSNAADAKGKASQPVEPNKPTVKADAPMVSTPKAAEPKVVEPKSVTPKAVEPKAKEMPKASTNVKAKETPKASTSTKAKEAPKAPKAKTTTSVKKDVKTVSKTTVKKDASKAAVKPANTKVAAANKATAKTDKAKKADQKVKATQKKAKQLPKTGSPQSGVLVTVGSLFIAGLTFLSTRLFRSKKSNM